VLNAVGFFIGPTAVAMVTDYYFADESQLRYSMFIVATIVFSAEYPLPDSQQGLPDSSICFFYLAEYFLPESQQGFRALNF